jgi:RHS repeat-associated protein
LGLAAAADAQLTVGKLATADCWAEVYVENLSSQAVWFDDLEIATGALPTALVVQETHYDPWGLELAGIGYIADATLEDKFTYNGKEKVDDMALNWLDYGARNYDARLGRWWSVDGRAEKYLSFSPYHYCANNPMRFLDVDGNEFTQAAEAWVRALSREIGRRIDANNRSSARQVARTEKFKAKHEAGKMSQAKLDRKVARAEARIEANGANNAEMHEVLNEISEMRHSSQVYNVVEDNSMSNVDGMGNGTISSGARFNLGTGQFDIRMDRRGGVSQFAHELKHAHQFEIGNFSSGVQQNAGAPFQNLFYDKHDELEAYRRGELFGGPRHRRLNDLPSIYQQIANGPVDAATHPNTSGLINLAPRGQAIPQLQTISNAWRHTFRVNGVTYQPRARQ